MGPGVHLPTSENGSVMPPSFVGEPVARLARGHVTQFYEEDAALLDALVPIIGQALVTGDAAIVLATSAHRTALAERLLAEVSTSPRPPVRGAMWRLMPRTCWARSCETVTRIVTRSRPS